LPPSRKRKREKGKEKKGAEGTQEITEEKEGGAGGGEQGGKGGKEGGGVRMWSIARDSLRMHLLHSFCLTWKTLCENFQNESGAIAYGSPATHETQEAHQRSVERFTTSERHLLAHIICYL
jgi:hypothetical protein